MSQLSLRNNRRLVLESIVKDLEHNADIDQAKDSSLANIRKQYKSELFLYNSAMPPKFVGPIVMKCLVRKRRAHVLIANLTRGGFLFVKI